MNIFQIALNNLKRRKKKMVFLMLGLMIGVATVITFANVIEAMNLDLGDRIDELGANAVIMPRFEGMQMNYDNMLVSELAFDIQALTMEDIPKIYTSEVAEYIHIVSPKLIGSANVNGQPALVVGVDMKEEFTQKPWFTLEQQTGSAEGAVWGNLALTDIPDGSVIVGASAAKALSLQAGDSLLVNEKPFHVFGILKPLGSEEDGLIYMHLGMLQALLNRPGELSMIEISAYCNFCPIEEVAMGLDQALPNGRTIPVRQAALFREETIEKFYGFGLVFSGIVILISALVILITMLSSLHERTREIGIFRSIGFRRSHITAIMLIEVGLVGFFGGLAGFIAGSASTYFIGPYLAQIQGQISLQVSLLLPSVILSILLAMVASLYPVLKAARLDPVQALRFI